MLFYQALNAHHSAISCIAMMASYFRIPFTLPRQERDQAMTSDEIAACLESIELKVEVVKPNDISVLAKIKTPMITWKQDNGARNYFIILKTNKKTATIFDPLSGKKRIALSLFARTWSGSIIICADSKSLLSPQRHKKLLSLFLSLIVSRGKIFAMTIFISIIIIVFGIASSFYLGFLIDEVLFSRSELTLHILSIGVIAITLFTGILDSTRTYLLTVLGKEVDLSLIFSYFKHIIELPVSLLDKLKTGDILSRLDYVGTMRYIISDVSITIIMDSLLVISVGLVLFFQSPVLFCVTLSASILSSLLIGFLMKSYNRIYHDLMKKNSTAWSYIVEILSGLKTIRALNATRFVFNHFEKTQMDSVIVSYKLNIRQNIQKFIIGLIDGWSGNLVFWIGSYLILRDTMTLGALIAFNSLLAFFMGPFKNLLSLQPNFQEALVTMNRLNELLPVEAPSLRPTYIVPERIDGKIEIKNLYFSYNEKQPVLNGVDLDIQPGERVALVGKSGCGKTTLINLLLKYYNPVSGAILIDNYNILDIDDAALKMRIGYVPQDIFVFSDTIAANISIQRPDAPLEEIIDAARRAGAHEFIENTPDRYNTVLAERGQSLSGGQRQRIALARSLLGNPNIFIFDEATSNIDSISERFFYEVMDYLEKEGKTVIIIAHRLSIVATCSKIFVMDKGKIVDQGTHEELLARKSIYTELWQEESK
jgi:ATP-binding cassette subfamily B protein